jgi:hypothetical protein
VASLRDSKDFPVRAPALPAPGFHVPPLRGLDCDDRPQSALSGRFLRSFGAGFSHCTSTHDLRRGLQSFAALRLACEMDRRVASGILASRSPAVRLAFDRAASIRRVGIFQDDFGSHEVVGGICLVEITGKLQQYAVAFLISNEQADHDLLWLATAPRGQIL